MEDEVIKEQNEEVSTEEIQDPVLNLDFFISEVKRRQDILQFQINYLIRFAEDDDALLGFLSKFGGTLGFKLKNLINNVLELEHEIMGSSINDYYTEIFNEDYHDIETNSKINRLVDLILTQYFSIVDVFVTYASKIKIKGIDNQALDSLGSLYWNLNQNKISKDNNIIFSEFIKLKDKFENIKAYRDYLIHHGNVSIEKMREPANNNNYAIYSFYMYKIIKQPGKVYSKSKKIQEKVNLFLRYHLLILLVCFNDALENIKNKFDSLEDFDEKQRDT